VKITSKQLSELENYVELERSEIGDYLSVLLNLHQFPESYGKSPELQPAIDKELLHWLDRFKNETRIIEVVETRADVVYDRLLWLI